MNEFSITLSDMNTVTEGHTLYNLCERTRIRKSMETENRSVVAGWRKELRVKVPVSFWIEENILVLVLIWIVKALNATKFCFKVVWS